MRKINDKVVFIWHDFLNWWNAIPQEILAIKLMHHYEVTRFLMSLTSFIAFIGIPYSFISRHSNQIPVNIQQRILMLIFLYNLGAFIFSCLLLEFKGHLSGVGLKPFISMNKLVFFVSAIYAAWNAAGKFRDGTFVPAITLCLCLCFLLYCYSKIIQWLIKLSVNKDIIWTKELKKFQKDSVWHQFEQRYRQNEPEKAEGHIYNSYYVISPKDYKKMWRERLVIEQQTVNSSMLVALNAGLPYQLVQQAKKLDQAGVYSLPTVKLETPWPLKYRFEIMVDYFETMKEITPKDVEKNFENKSD